MSRFALHASGESGEGLISRAHREMQRRAYERWCLQPWTPSTQLDKPFSRFCGTSFTWLWVKSRYPKWTLWTHAHILSWARLMSGLRKRTGSKRSAAWCGPARPIAPTSAGISGFRARSERAEVRALGAFRRFARPRRARPEPLEPEPEPVEPEPGARRRRRLYEASPKSWRASGGVRKILLGASARRKPELLS